MSGFSIALMLMIVFLSMKPTVLKANHSLKEARKAMVELRRRQQALSNKIRALARESLGQRLTAGQDDHEADELQSRTDHLKRTIELLEAEDRRVLVMDERRGLSETGWIICVRRRPDAASPLEPSNITRLWDEGRYVFFFASDMPRARRKVLMRFPEDGGYSIVDVKPHEGDLSEPPALGAHNPDKQKQSA
ncbi:hypothetical protein [Niveispirillum cyanobacteriorum]|uniref:Uncharacterized protein n=1 Tax=Niveispirillum cyanobacteriorum TaxID=1612173 RepID=A0A2K9NAH1_9PROT|nr:hypothetical protein [Niveispirillum cyanobacteriorum]AUN29165.1 hypothetical protein C0V82_02065 [Niveispirillum cyanobacteriorum]GGE66852.1 hypothetical protein GCM10011317_25200 [Niveispirillum cyanobacteriorum]